MEFELKVNTSLLAFPAPCLVFPITCAPKKPRILTPDSPLHHRFHQFRISTVSPTELCSHYRFSY